MSDTSWIGQSVSWIIIFTGWLVVNRQNNNRETRKEVRASLLELYKHLDSIEDAALKYHTTNGDAGLARTIRRDIQQIAPRIVMARRGPMKIDYGKSVSAFRKAVTLHNFDSSKFVSKSSDDPFFDEISDSKRNLIFLLEQAYGRAYP